MTDDSGTLSIDFIVGFTIFLIAFIWVVSLVPGLLINLQGFTIDYDAVAYRTGVILVEDPGEPSSWEIAPFQQNFDKSKVLRFGLAVSRDDPNILSIDKVNRFFDTATFNAPDYRDYHDRSVFGDYPYRFNISLRYIGSNKSTRSVGNVLPDGYGYIRRFVKVKSMSNASIDGSNNASLISKGYINGDNETIHIFSILMNNNDMIGKESLIKDPAYQIIPGRESFMINFTSLNSTMWEDRENCFNISLNSILAEDGQGNQTAFKDPIIDEIPIHMESPKPVISNISILYNTTTNRKGINWDAPQIKISLIFNLTKTNSGCICSTCPGSRFLNNTPVGSPFVYDYNPVNVTQPQLRDAVVEVAVW